MEIAMHELTVLPSGDLAAALGADAAGAAFDLTVYVQQARVVALSLLCADRPLGNVIRPDVGPTGGRLFTGPGVLVAHNRRWLLLAQVRLV